MSIKELLKKKILLYYFLAILVYLITGIYFLKYYEYQINPDGISYILIAEKYVNGDIQNGLNAYWSPLFSWLLIPFISIKTKPLLACKILNFIIGFFTIIGIILLTYRFELEEYLRATIAFAATLPLLWWGFSKISPDLLSIMINIYYFIFIFDKNYINKKYSCIICGILGSVAYLAKAYNFPFFLFNFLLINIIHCIFQKKLAGQILKKYLCGLIVFTLISLPWIILISQKYKTITFSSTGKYNYAALTEGGHPMHTQGFIKPFPGSEISVWEDPSLFKFNMPENHKKLVLNNLELLIKRNLNILIKCYNSFSGSSVNVIIIFLTIIYWKNILHDISYLSLVLTFITHPAGYVILHLEDRFVWICGILIIFMGAYLLNLIKNKNNISIIIILTFFVISFWYYPFYLLNKNIDTGKDFYSLSEAIKKRYNITGNIGSDNGYWAPTLYISYYLKVKYYGETNDKNITYKELNENFQKYDIDYYFQWDRTNREIINELSKNYTRINDPTLPFFIYKIKSDE